MKKFTPYEKLSKKKQRELDSGRRSTWNGINPVTRKAANPKAYNRRKAQTWKNDSSFVPFLWPVRRKEQGARDLQFGAQCSMLRVVRNSACSCRLSVHVSHLY